MWDGTLFPHFALPHNIGFSIPLYVLFNILINLKTPYQLGLSSVHKSIIEEILICVQYILKKEDAQTVHL